MALLVTALPNPPCILHEDEHLLVVNKPSGINTHSPSPYAGEGIYEWLRNREQRWAALSIIHRLDKGTSGVMVFGKSKRANQSLTAQFSSRAVRKQYLFLTGRKKDEEQFALKCALSQAGEKYVARKPHAGGEIAETRFEFIRRDGQFYLWRAEPLTGRTHQIRAQAEFAGIPIMGDELYGGTPFARVCLHAEELEFKHPQEEENVIFRAEAEFFRNAACALRSSLIEPGLTNSFRILHGESDSARKTYVERWGEYLLTQSETGVHPEDELTRALGRKYNTLGCYEKRLQREVRKSPIEEAAPRLLFGREAPKSFLIQENGLKYEISFRQGYSVGLFLDQRENRRRALTGQIAPGFALEKPKEVLNTFAYTCGFSLCAAVAGSKTTSVDLSKKYLEWGQRNFKQNGVDPAQHKFIFGDVFDWAERLRKKGRQYDLIFLDPPTFSKAKKGRSFVAEKNYGELIQKILPLLRRGGVLFASTNAHGLPAEDFLRMVEEGTRSARRRISQSHYVAQPFDFPISREEPAYLKTVWLRVE